MGKLRHQTDSYRPRDATRRWKGLQDRIYSGQWTDRKKTTLIYWDGTRWLRWDGPDPLAQIRVGVATAGADPKFVKCE